MLMVTHDHFSVCSALSKSWLFVFCSGSKEGKKGWNEQHNNMLVCEFIMLGRNECLVESFHRILR